MWMTRAKSVFAGTVLSVGVALGCAGSAQAAVYTGSWDPAYGQPFPDLYWTANAVFDVPGSCLGQADGTYTLSDPSCSGFSITSATLTFYQNDGGSPGTFLESFNLNTSADIQGIQIAGGALVGVNTNYFTPVVPTIDSAIDGNGDYSFSLLLFGGNLAQLAYINPITNTVGCLSSIPGQPEQNCGFSETNAVGVFAPIPEPGTYALMLAGLGAIGFVARRRAR